MRNDAVQPADLIFVIAGRLERKNFGLELFSAGVAPRLVLSVGRFEVSKMRHLNVGGIEELLRLRDKTPPVERHFFMVIERNKEDRIERVFLPRWSTYGEALAVRSFLEREPARRVIVVSTDVHLRRVFVTFSKVFQNHDIAFRYCAVPARLTSFVPQAWWTRPGQRRLVITEMIKLVGYRIILWMPPWATRRLMRVN